MLIKKISTISFFLLSYLIVFSAEPSTSYKLYGFVRSELYYNSRQNVEALDGLFNILPKPKEEYLFNGQITDKNNVANSQMISISTRLGLDFNSTDIFGAKSSAKIECDFAGISSSYYLIRLRQAYLKLNWGKTELLVGQTWHPMFSNLQPITPALSVGTPFQSFNRSPQIRLKYNLNTNLSALVAFSYQMQYLTQGTSGASAVYMKNGLLPGLHLCIDYKSKNILAGVGVDGKSLKINHERFNSGAAVAYMGYINKKFQLRAKTILGQNLSEYLMIGGYGISGTNATTNEASYTNFNTSTSWLSVAYGAKVQVGIYGGFSQNLGTNKNLLASTTGKFTAYGYGYYQDSQSLLDQLYRVAPHITYNLSNFKLGFEYELTTAKYGTILSSGRVSNEYSISNHRAVASISYLF